MRTRAWHKLFLLWLFSTGLIVWFSGCGGDHGGGPGPGPSAQTAPVSFYFTDDISNYGQVTATINSVSMINAASGQTCTVLSNAVSLDLTGLANTLQLVNVSNCPSGSYTRLHMAFDRNVILTNSSGVTNTCAFNSFRTAPGAAPNVISCIGNNCSIDLTGAVDVLPNQNAEAGMDFDLKNFDVSGFGTNACSVTMTTTPMNASEMDQRRVQGYHSGMTGFPGGFANNSLTIGVGPMSFLVNSGGIANQTGLGNMVGMAQANGFPMQVICSETDISSGMCNATNIFVLASGTVSSLNTVLSTFNLTAINNATLNVGFSNAAVLGTFQNGVFVTTKLDSFDSTTDLFNAVLVRTMLMGVGNMPGMPGPTPGGPGVMPGGEMPMM